MGVRTRNMIANFLERFGYYKISDLQVGGHCGFCGRPMSDTIFPHYWPYGLCDKCKAGNRKTCIGCEYAGIGIPCGNCKHPDAGFIAITDTALLTSRPFNCPLEMYGKETENG